MQNKSLAITVCATKSYRYAMRSQAHRVAACLSYAGRTKADVVLVGDDSIEEVGNEWARILGFDVRILRLKTLKETGENYKKSAQLRIASMRTEMFNATRSSDLVWTLDSDVLPPPNALRCMEDVLQFDNGYYHVAFCTYPNDGPLGGMGVHAGAVMAPNIYEDERKLTPELRKERDALNKAFRAIKRRDKIPEELTKKAEELRKKIEECPPDGNIFTLQGRRWRRRGWLDHAYPGIGLGAVLPSAWAGFGCNLHSRKAADLCDWTGYDGGGTEDVFITAFRWNPAGIRIAVVPHVYCSHVVGGFKKEGRGDGYVLLHAYHEHDGEQQGHLRTRPIPWVPEFSDVDAQNTPPVVEENPKPSDSGIILPNTERVS